jgi:hypothetical protein
MTFITPPTSVSNIKFDALGKTRSMDCEKALRFAKKKMESHPGSSLHFTNLVASRALVTVSLKHEFHPAPIGPRCDISVQTPIKMSTWFSDGPFTANQFIKMMEFSTEASNSAWYDHLYSFEPIDLSSTENKAVNKNS